MTFAYTRQQLRDYAAGAIKVVDPRVSVFNGKHITNVEKSLPAVSVTLDGMSIEANLSDQMIVEGALNIVIVAEGADATVDELADPIIDAVIQQYRMHAPTIGINLISMEYDRELDAGLAAIGLTFTVRWT